MKKIIFGAMAAVALLACSQDQVIEQNRANDEITFSVVAENQTKAADIYCNNHLPKSFKVYAYRANEIYIDGDVIEYQNGAWVNTSGTRYWPNDGVDLPITFYAAVNAGDSFQCAARAQSNGGSVYFRDFEVPVNVNDQVDLLYAVSHPIRPNGTVQLNFRHALSQVVFQAKNINANLYVEIKGVSVCNLGNKLSFTYGNNSTGSNIVNHTGSGETSTATFTQGSWDELKGGRTNYAVEFTPVPVPGDSQVKSLTNTNVVGKEYSTNALLLLPQNTTPWDPTVSKPGYNEYINAGTYFLVDCKICNVAGDEYNEDKDIVLWNGKTAIPAEFNWEQGKKYIYTFVFGNGNGGYDPDPDGPSTPNPVLVPIEFEITVDDFIPVASEDIAMETEK